MSDEKLYKVHEAVSLTKSVYDSDKMLWHTEQHIRQRRKVNPEDEWEDSSIQAEAYDADLSKSLVEVFTIVQNYLASCSGDLFTDPKEDIKNTEVKQ
jgi:hypothetical protein